MSKQENNDNYEYKKFVKLLRMLTIIIVVSLFVVLSIYFNNFWLSLISIPILMVTKIFE